MFEWLALIKNRLESIFSCIFHVVEPFTVETPEYNKVDIASFDGN